MNFGASRLVLRTSICTVQCTLMLGERATVHS
jgi:hypothetical protein